MPAMHHISISALVIALLALTAGCVAANSTPTPTVPPPPARSETAKSMAIANIKDWPEVVDAAIAHVADGNWLSLLLVFVSGLDQYSAEFIGEKFARAVKALSPDEAPEVLELGKGLYTYVVTVRYPDGQVIATGAKVPSSRSMTW